MLQVPPGARVWLIQFWDAWNGAAGAPPAIATSTGDVLTLVTVTVSVGLVDPTGTSPNEIPVRTTANTGGVAAWAAVGAMVKLASASASPTVAQEILLKVMIPPEYLGTPPRRRR